MRASCDAKLVVEELLAVSKDDLLLISVDIEHARFQSAVDIGVREEGLVAEGPLRRVTDGDCLRKKGAVIGHHRFIRHNSDLTREARLTKSLSAVEASWTTANDDVVLSVIRVSLGERHGDFARESLLRNLDKELTVFLNDGE